MIQDPYTMQAVAEIRYQERLREAEHARLLRQLDAGQTGLLRRVCATLLLASGAKLTRMGGHLRPAQQPQMVSVQGRRR